MPRQMRRNIEVSKIGAIKYSNLAKSWGWSDKSW